jgi:GT2 family glycosyltransferase
MPQTGPHLAQVNIEADRTDNTMQATRISAMKSSNIRRTALVVAGMHRSGTSSVAGALVAMGCSPPRTLMPPADDNPTGFWESSRLMELNDRILASAGSMWCDWRPFNPDWFETPLAEAFRGEAQLVIEDEFPKQPLFVFKDPRICRFLPIWIDALTSIEIAVKIVIPIRHPVEVAMSLVKRNGLSPHIGHLLWLRHVLDAEYFSRQSSRVILMWDQFLKQPARSMKRLSEQLRIKWPRHQDFALLDANTFVSGDLKHNKRDVPPPPIFLSDLAEEVYVLIEALAQTGSGPELQRLDEIRAKISTASEILGPLLAPAERLMHSQLTSSPGSALFAPGDPIDNLLNHDRFGLYVPQLRDGSAGTQPLRAELDEVQGQLANSNSALQAALSRADDAETKTGQAQRELEGSLRAHREALQRAADTNSRLEAAQRQSADLQRALDQALERAHQGAQLQARNLSELNTALLDCQEKLRAETVKASLAMREAERYSAECQQLRLSLQDYRSSSEAAHKAEIQLAQVEWEKESQSRLRQLGKTALDALSLSSDLLRQSIYRLEQKTEAFRQWELQAAEMSGRLFPELAPYDGAPGSSAFRMSAFTRALSKLSVFRLVAKGNEANRNKNWSVAAFCYARALARAPFLAPIWVQYGHALKEKGDRNLAEIAYRRAIGLEPFNPDTYLQLGHLMKLLGRTDAARAAYRRSTELDPSQPHARNELSALPEPQALPSLQALDTAMEAVIREASLGGSAPSDVRPAALLTSSQLAWPPSLHNSFWLPQGLRDFIVENYGEGYPDLYRYLSAIIDRYGSDSQAFANSADCRILVERAAAKATNQAGQPKTSIVIPAFNNVCLTMTCIVALLETSANNEFEILVGDDASTDATPTLIARIGGRVKLVRHDVNMGFLLNCNETAKQATGKYIVMLNNDTLALPGWLDHLIEPFERDPSIGMTGSMLLNADGTLQEAGGIFWQDGSAWNFGRNQDPRLPEFNYAKEVDYISGASITLPTDLWRKLGGFDPAYSPAYCEDADLAFRIREQNLKVWYEPRSKIVHHEGRSHGKDVTSGIKAYQVTNQRKLAHRWAKVLERDHFENAQNVITARDRSRSKPRILVIDHYVPQKDRDAGSRTMYTYMKLLVGAGFHVTFWPDNLYRDPEYTPELQSLGIEVLYFTQHLCPKFEDWIAQHGPNLDYALLSRPHVASKYIDTLTTFNGIKLLFYGVDLHFLRMETQYNLSPSPDLLKQIEITRTQELGICRRFDVVYYPGIEEVNYLRPRLPSAVALREFPIYVYDDNAMLQADKMTNAIPQIHCRDILFVGGFNHSPNEDGILWFVAEIMPALRKLLPGVRLHIVGSNPPQSIHDVAADDIVVHGRVSDDRLDDLYRTVSAAIVPLRFGGGVKGKVIEPMAKGVPVVMTTIGAQGIDYADTCAFVADNPDAFAFQVTQCVNRRDEAQKKARNALEFIRRKYSIHSVSSLLSMDISELRPTDRVHH